jgi:undecaprenyl-phosphate 4-deoxy-4-formamido-L-arabinose transferase
LASRLINALRERTTRIRISDHGCMFRGYARSIVDAINQCTENNTFVPALAYTFASRPTEIDVRHEDRVAGESKYSMYRLIKLNFDLMTGFSTVPMQLYSALGFFVSMVSILFGVALVVRRLIGGAEAAEQGMFTLFALAFLLIGVTLFGIGLLGEYVGRIYEEVRRRPRYLVGAVLERPQDSP